MGKNFIERIKKLDKLTPSETKIADFFSRNYDELVFENLSSISRKAEVSKPTVLRFISKLGFKQFAAFNDELRKELKSNHDSMHIRYSLKKKVLNDGNDDIIAQTFTNTINNLENTYNNIDEKKFNLIAESLAKCDGKIYITGQRSSYALSYIFNNMIRRVLSNTILIEPQSSLVPDALIDITDKDVVFGIYRRPYSSETNSIIKYFAEIGSEIILITDSELNPLSKVSTHQLSVNTEGVSVFTSSTSLLAILEALNIAILNFCDESVADRLEKAEHIYKKFNTFHP
ncbi:MAG: MurR/RpiR family transcriptional regulator [Desulfobacterales bacterium]|nr:MurR/RpiR family transcriptional regulator [Desulfobacterales bacterium]MCP4163124.1 MurR/RpiR family transcriptional regulator [Deltaproteobacteria bacterium]